MANIKIEKPCEHLVTMEHYGDLCTREVDVPPDRACLSCTLYLKPVDQTPKTEVDKVIETNFL